MRPEVLALLEVDVQPATRGGALVLVCAAFGSPVPEQARVVASAPERLLGAVHGWVVLSVLEADLLSLWADCAAWRTFWRAGSRDELTPERLAEVERAASVLAWVPGDWCADMRRARAGEWCTGPLAPVGQRRANQVLTPDDVEAIRHAVASGQRQVDVAKRYGVSQPRVSQIVRGAR